MSQFLRELANFGEFVNFLFLAEFAKFWDSMVNFRICGFSVESTTLFDFFHANSEQTRSKLANAQKAETAEKPPQTPAAEHVANAEKANSAIKAANAENADSTDTAEKAANDATAENTANAETADNKNTDKNRERRTDRQKKITATNETPRNQQQSPVHGQPIPKQPKTQQNTAAKVKKKNTEKAENTLYVKGDGFHGKTLLKLNSTFAIL